jgi:hypothetical protein
MTSRRRSNRDHAKKHNQPIVEEEVIAGQLEALLTPAIFNQINQCISDAGVGSKYDMERISPNYSIE